MKSIFWLLSSLMLLSSCAVTNYSYNQSEKQMYAVTVCDNLFGCANGIGFGETIYTMEVSNEHALQAQQQRSQNIARALRGM
jgi:hypothetical protein